MLVFQHQTYDMQRHLRGIFKTRAGDEYEGAWYLNEKEGEGVQKYAV